jgi:hypothetical protein
MVINFGDTIEYERDHETYRYVRYRKMQTVGDPPGSNKYLYVPKEDVVDAGLPARLVLSVAPRDPQNLDLRREIARAGGS